MYGLIYKHTCLISGKAYIGQTTKSCEERWREHLYEKRKGKTKFSKALLKYNEKYWKHEVLAYAKDKEDLDCMEDYFIKKFDTINNGYNLKYGGSYGKHSTESKIKMSEKRKGIGRPHTEQSKQRISAALKGKSFSDFHKKNISEAKRGKTWTEKQKEAYRDKFTGNKNPNFGKKTSQETINEMRKKMGKPIFCKELKKEFSCAGEAAEFLGIKRCGIQKCLIKGGTSHGYHWSYIKD